jgi:hypothetical protein
MHTDTWIIPKAPWHDIHDGVPQFGGVAPPPVGR